MNKTKMQTKIVVNYEAKTVESTMFTGPNIDHHKLFTFKEFIGRFDRLDRFSYGGFRNIKTIEQAVNMSVKNGVKITFIGGDI